MIRTLALPFVPLLLVGAALPAAEPAKEGHAQAVAALKKLGARIDADQAPDGQTWLTVTLHEKSFGPNWKGTEADLKHLAKLDNLRAVNLHLSQVTDDGLRHLAGLKGLKGLGIHGPKVTDRGLEHLQALTDLGYLSVSHTQVSEAGLAGLNLKKLERLEVSCSQVAAVRLDDFPRLTYLDLTGPTAKRLHARRPHPLKRLELQDTRIAEGGLACLRHLNKLETLYLNRTPLTDKGLEPLCGLAGLKVLDLRGARHLTDAGLGHLKGLDRLEILYLSYTKVGDAGLAHLKGLKRLLRLELVGTGVTDAGLEHLHGLDKLVYVEIDRTAVTPAGVQNLRRALPKLEHP
jgi:hypothetical protein